MNDTEKKYSNNRDEIIEDYNNHHHFHFFYKGQEHFLVCGPDYDVILDGLYAVTAKELYRCEPGKALTDIIIDGEPLLDILAKVQLSVY